MAGNEGAEFPFPLAVGGFYVYRQMLVPHLGQRLCGKENTATWKTFAIAVLKHRARGDEDSITMTVSIVVLKTVLSSSK